MQRRPSQRRTTRRRSSRCARSEAQRSPLCYRYPLQHPILQYPILHAVPGVPARRRGRQSRAILHAQAGRRRPSPLLGRPRRACVSTRPRRRRDSPTSAPGLAHICAGTLQALGRVVRARRGGGLVGQRRRAVLAAGGRCGRERFTPAHRGPLTAAQPTLRCARTRTRFHARAHARARAHSHAHTRARRRASLRPSHPNRSALLRSVRSPSAALPPLRAGDPQPALATPRHASAGPVPCCTMPGRCHAMLCHAVLCPAACATGADAVAALVIVRFRLRCMRMVGPVGRRGARLSAHRNSGLQGLRGSWRRHDRRHRFVELAAQSGPRPVAVQMWAG